MRRVTKIAGTLLATGAIAAAGIVTAHANWTVSSKPVALKVTTERVPRGVTPSAAVHGKSAVVSWSAQEITADIKMDRYVVTAHSVGNPPRPDISHTVRATGGAVESITFAADEVGGGKWYWTVVPKFHLWSGAESGKSRRLTFPAAPMSAPPPVATLAPTAFPEPIDTPTSPSGTPPTVTATPVGTPATGTPTTEAAPVDLPSAPTEPPKGMPSMTPSASAGVGE